MVQLMTWGNPGTKSDVWQSTYAQVPAQLLWMLAQPDGKWRGFQVGG